MLFLLIILILLEVNIINVTGKKIIFDIPLLSDFETNQDLSIISLNNALASIKTKDEFAVFVNTMLRKMLPIKYFFSFLLTDDQRSFIPYLFNQRDDYTLDKNFEAIMSHRTFVNESNIRQLLTDGGTMKLKLKISKDAPPILNLLYKYGIKQVVLSIPFPNTGSVAISGFCIDPQANASQTDIELITKVTGALSTSISLISAREEVEEIEREEDMILSFSSQIARVRDKQQLSGVIEKGLNELIGAKDYFLSLGDGPQQQIDFDCNTLKCESAADRADIEKIIEGFAEQVLSTVGLVDFNLYYNSDQSTAAPDMPLCFKAIGASKIVGVKIVIGTIHLGILWIFSEWVNERLISGITDLIAISLSNILANKKIERQLEEISGYKEQLEIENEYLKQTVKSNANYHEIIGNSSAITSVFDSISQVAATESTVLILGETGTGKELVARTLHNNSMRKDKRMVTVNCATLSKDLIESELFGYERGSFTGAYEKRIGKFEQAQDGTLFLDEIGELSLELQTKLLRVLQEKEFERIGGTSVIKTNARIIVATNRNLIAEVSQGNFRGDLYFRLSVFPIELPSLRNRKDDIPSLAFYFLKKFEERSNKSGMGISSNVMKELMRYSWPGNIRELEHVIERAVLTCSTTVVKQIYIPSPDSRETDTILPDLHVKTIDEIDREHIIAVLKRCGGKIAGIGGAAELLKLPATTLNSKIKKLNIKKGIIGGTDS